MSIKLETLTEATGTNVLEIVRWEPCDDYGICLKIVDEEDEDDWQLWTPDVYTLANICKIWASEQGYDIISRPISKCRGFKKAKAYVVCDEFEKNCTLRFDSMFEKEGDNEADAIFKCLEWVEMTDEEAEEYYE